MPKKVNLFTSVILVLVMQISAMNVGIHCVMYSIGSDSFSMLGFSLGVFGMAFCTYLKISESFRVYKK